MTPRMTALINAAVFASGVSALVFEMLCIRQAGLAFGNSVMASSLVLSGFMSGLVVGYVLAGRLGPGLRNPIRAYAFAEIAIAVTGVGLVTLLPAVGTILTPWFGALDGHPLALNSLRLVLAFLLLLVPTTAMGATLPLVTGALTRHGQSFGTALGQVYGWNTLGSVIGVIAAEAYLVGALGIRGSALAAGALNLAAACAAAMIARHAAGPPPPAIASGHARAAQDAARRRLLLAAALSGFCLLALEVIWFRFLLLYVKGHALALALILGLVLLGVGAGGLLASRWLRAVPSAFRYMSATAFLASAASVAVYAAFPSVVDPAGPLIVDVAGILRAAAWLVLPVSVLSGISFTLQGAALREHGTSGEDTAGGLASANTIGAATGSLAGGLVLLPLLGIERSLFAIALLYGCTGLLLASRGPRRGWAAYAPVVGCLGALVLFPFGVMDTRLLPLMPDRWLQAGESARVTAVREGVAETIVYFERLVAGVPVSRAMLTNSFSMSATGYGARRYMKLYVYWPLAVHPHVKHALLIGYGVGNTAKAMTDSRDIETIDVVDRSRDVVAMGPVIYPDPAAQPLRDPRVRVHIDDGRYFLQTTGQRFDLITGEPPPPGIAGVEHLYSREYFRALHDRLAEGGITTYWLPTSDLSAAGTKAILAGFCAAFDDCSLWHGAGTHLMMVGTRGGAPPVSAEEFGRQWREPDVAVELRRLGFETPGQLGALFIGDAEFIARVVGATPALTDEYPKRIETPSSPAEDATLLRAFTDVEAARARFESSAFISARWPAAVTSASLAYFDAQGIINTHLYGTLLPQPNAIAQVHDLLVHSSLREPVRWRLGSNADIDGAFNGPSSPRTSASAPLQSFHAGVRNLSERGYAAAAAWFRRAAELAPPADAGALADSGLSSSTGDDAFALYVYALCMSGQIARAQEVTRGAWEASIRAQGLDPDGARGTALPPFWIWMKDTFGIDPRVEAPSTHP